MTDTASVDEPVTNPPVDVPDLPATRPRKRDIHGWVILDKPVEMTSTHAVAVVKRLMRARKAGHAGTLDPLASGILPIALGEATKTVPYVMDGQKSYRFTVSWGSQTDTDDTEGRVIATSDQRPTRANVEALLPRFRGAISQVPPKYSAIKIAGERAYDLARDGEDVVLEPREVRIDALEITDHTDDATVLDAQCGKGTYVRAIARDLGLALGCFGHVSALRRTRVGPFDEAAAVDVVTLAALDEPAVAPALLPVASALAELDRVNVSRSDAGRLRRGQDVLLRGPGMPLESGPLAVLCGSELIALGRVESGALKPLRIFNLGA